MGANQRLYKQVTDKPDTVAEILGFKDYGPDWEKNKQNHKHVKERLKKEETQAWVETTKNLVKKDNAKQGEIKGLK